MIPQVRPLDPGQRRPDQTGLRGLEGDQRLVGVRGPSQDLLLGAEDLAEAVRSALTTLEARDAKVLRLYFGLEGEREHTLEEIGNMLGVTRERIRQLRDRALRRLREGERGSALESFAA